MLDSVSEPVALAFILVTALTLIIFGVATYLSKRGWLLVLLWTAIQSVLAYLGFYRDTSSLPPRFLLVLLPTTLAIIYVFRSAQGKPWVSEANVPLLVLIHTIRIPVELILYQLFVAGAIPELMTFAGRNFDILAGITAPVVYYFGYRQQFLNHKVRIAWHIISLALLANIVVHAILSTPFPFQQLAFDQPNLAITTFPFLLLPGLVVPLVIVSHFIVLRYEWQQKDWSKAS